MMNFFTILLRAGLVHSVENMDPSVAVGERIAEERAEVLLQQAAVSGFSPSMLPCVLYPTHPSLARS